MKEICTIGSQVWHVGNPPTGHLQPGFAFSYAFYDQHTGEVWGKRTVVEGRTLWVYTSRGKSGMDLTIPLEWLEDAVPVGLLCAIVVAAGEKLQSTNAQ